MPIGKGCCSGCIVALVIFILIMAAGMGAFEAIGIREAKEEFFAGWAIIIAIIAFIAIRIYAELENKDWF